MKTIQHILLAAGLLAASISHAVFIPTVQVGNPGNAAQSSANRAHGFSEGDGFGSVGYSYHIGTTPVTNTQYTAFLNAVARTNGDPHGLYNTNMGSIVHGGISRTGGGTVSDPFTYSVRTATSGFNNGQSMGEMPVNFVSFWSAARFSNWLTSGNTETGVYVLDATGITNNTITRDATAWNNGGVAIASENEWYKAAYYDGNGGYTLYPTQSNSITTADANYDNSVGTVTDVGTYAHVPSHYGTFDQGGNVWEWNDEILFTSDRGLRSGSFSGSENGLRSSFRLNVDPTGEHANVGFRVSSLAPIPEPSTYAAILGCLGLALALMRRKGRRKIGIVDFGMWI